MSNFVWETEEDQEKEWPNPEADITVEEPASPTRTWLYILPVFALLMVTALVIYNQLQRRIADTEAAMTADIVSSFELAQLAAVEQDDEMLTSLLSGRDLGWVDAQIEATAVGTLFDRASFGLQLVGDPTILPDATQFNEQLDAAELTIQQQYQDPYRNSVILERTLQFREGTDRWLWSPLEGEFWGEQLSVLNTDETLELVYPERDAAVIERIRPTLEQQIAILCTDNGMIDLNCGDFGVLVEFTTDPAVLVGSSDPRFWLQTDGRLTLTLPTPTLFGKPVDEAGYNALARAYAAPILTQLIVERKRYECCADGFAFAAVIDKYLERAQIRPYPLTTADYQQYFQNPFVLNNRNLRTENNQTIAQTERQHWRTLLTIDLILSQTDMTPDQLLATINERPNIWLDQLLDPFNSELGLDANTAILTYAAERGSHSPAALRTSLPQNQTLIAGCDASPDLWKADKYFQQYDWQAQAWQPVSPILTGASSLAIMSDDQGLIWTDYLNNGDTFSLLSQYGSQSSQLYQAPPEGSVFFRAARSISGRNNLVFSFYSFNESVSETLDPIAFLSSEECQNGNCRLTPQAGFIVWSPNETNSATVMFDPNGFILTIPETANTSSFSAPATWPYIWLDETHIIYRVPNSADPRDLALDFQRLNVSSGETETFLTAEQISMLPSASEEPWQLLIGQHHPTKPEIIAFTFKKGEDAAAMGPHELVFYNWQTAEVESTLPLPSGFFDLIPSPNGRWLLIDYFDTEARDILLDYTAYKPLTTFNGLLADNQSAFNARYDWSAEGDWLVQFQRGFALLYAPVTNESYPLLYPNLRDYCYGGGWTVTP